MNSISPYSLSKRAGEEALLELADAHFQPTILRKGTIYGFAPKMRYDLVLNSFTKDAYRSGKITVHAGGDIYRPMLDLQDAVAAYIAVMELPIGEVDGKVFNVSHWNCRMGDFAVEFADIVQSLGYAKPEIVLQQVGITRNYLVDNSKYLSTFGLAPTRSVRQAISELWSVIAKGHDVDNLRYYTDRWYHQAADNDASGTHPKSSHLA